MPTVLRSLVFRIAYWATSVFFVLCALPLLAVPARRPLMIWIRLYTRVMCFWMRWIAGIRLVYRGRERLPDGPFIIAAKHQSWGDGFAMVSQIPDLAFVTGDHLERFPLVGGVLRKMGAIVVNNCGGAHARARLVSEDLAETRAESRPILIYPEGHLAPVGKRYRYKKGVFHMYKAYDCPVVPAATTLGLRWPQQGWRLTPGEAVIEFLDPIVSGFDPDLDKETFMARLENAVETRSMELLGEERPDLSAPGASRLGALLPDPQERRRNGAGKAPDGERQNAARRP